MFIIGIWIIFSSPYFFTRLVPFPSDYLVSFFPPWSAAYGMPVKNNAMPDVITQIYPWKTTTMDSWAQGQIPLWNPYSFSGVPHAANYQTAVFSPFNILFFLFDRVDAWSILVLLQPLLAGWFMYIFLQSLRRSQAASLVGSISYMFCGFLVTWMAYGTLGYAALFLPFILFAIHRSLTVPAWWSFPLVSIGVALSFASGHFQISVYVLLASLFYAIWHARAHKIKQFFLVCFFIILGLLLAAPQLFISFDAYRESMRSASFIQGEIIPWNYLITLFSPDFFGNPVTRNDWFGHYAEWAGFFGVAPLLLALFALMRKNAATVWFFACLSLAAFLFALPTPLNDALFRMRIPVLSTSAASRIIVLSSFGLAVLSVFGLDALRRDWEKRQMRAFFAFAAAVMAAMVLLWTALYGMHLLPDDKLVIARRNTILPSLIAVLVLAGGVLGFIKNKRIGLAILAGLVMLTSFDLLRFAAKWMPYSLRGYMYPQMGVLSYLQENAKDARVFGNFGGEIMPFGIQGIEGYDALYPVRYGRFIKAADDGKLKSPERSVVLLGKGAPHAQRVLDLLGVKYVVHRLSDGRNVWAYPHWEYPQYLSVYKDDHYEVFENTRVLPRFFLASAYLIPDSDDETIATLFDENFDASNTVLLEKPAVPEPQAGEGAVSILTYTPNELVFTVNFKASETISLEVKTPVPKLFFISDTFDPGWKATIDGSPAEIYRANYDFRAIPVPQGEHILRMYYQPQSFRIGVAAAMISLFVLMGAGVRLYLYDHRHL